MKRKEISAQDLLLKPFHIFEKQWLLLTAGSYAERRYNTMTVGWGAFGTMWGRPLAMVVVRPTRYTHEFMEKYDSFSLCAFPETYRDKLEYLGTHSGRDEDKIAKTGLTACRANCIDTPVFEEAALAVECRKTYKTGFQPGNFMAPHIMPMYPQNDFHTMYFGDVVFAAADDNFAAQS